jgi:uncharacterized protein
MALRERFNEQMKEAMRAKDQKRLGTIRLVLAALKERDIANRSETSRDGISDEEILGLLAKMVKQREESVAAYMSGGRPELAEAERNEIAVIREFMPQQLSEAEMKKGIAEAITVTGAASIKDMGRVMGALKERYAGRLDFAKAGAEVRAVLSGQK